LQSGNPYPKARNYSHNIRIDLLLIAHLHLSDSHHNWISQSILIILKHYIFSCDYLFSLSFIVFLHPRSVLGQMWISISFSWWYSVDIALLISSFGGIVEVSINFSSVGVYPPYTF